MQGVYNYTCIPETNHVSRVYNIAATLYLHFMAHVMLFATLNVLYIAAVLSEVCALCTIWLFSVVL
jgi:hypothetical protein